MNWPQAVVDSVRMAVLGWVVINLARTFGTFIYKMELMKWEKPK